MKNHYKNNKGMALVICLMIMAVAAMIGIGISTDSTIDGLIARNQRDTKKDFFIADGSNLIKVASLIAPDGPAPSNPGLPELLEDGESDTSLPGPDLIKFRAKISYIFDRSDVHDSSKEGLTFKHYYYMTKTNARRNNRNQTGIQTTEREIGPGIGTSGLF